MNQVSRATLNQFGFLLLPHFASGTFTEDTRRIERLHINGLLSCRCPVVRFAATHHTARLIRRLIQPKTTATGLLRDANIFATKLALSLMQMILEASGKVECLPIGSARKLEDGEVRSAPCVPSKDFFSARQSTALQFDVKTS